MSRVSAYPDLVCARPVDAILALHLPDLNVSIAHEPDGDIASLFESIAKEKRSRLLRDMIFAPILSLVAEHGDRDPKRTIKGWAWQGLWQALSDFEPSLCQAAQNWPSQGDDQPPVPFMALAERGAELCHSGPTRLGGDPTLPADLKQVKELGHLLTLYPLLYRALAYLPDHMHALSRDQVNLFYSLYGQACAYGQDNGLRFLKALFAQLETFPQKIQIVERIGGDQSEETAAIATITDIMRALVADLTWRLSLIGQRLGRGLLNGKSAVAAADDIAQWLTDLDAVEAYGTSDNKAAFRPLTRNARMQLISLVERTLGDLASGIDALLPFTATASRLVVGHLDIDLSRDYVTSDLERAQGTLAFIRALDSLTLAGGFGMALRRAQAIIDAKLEGYLALLREKAFEPSAAQAIAIRSGLDALLSLIGDQMTLAQRDYAGNIHELLTLSPTLSPSHEDPRDATGDLLARAARRQLNRLK